MNAALQAIYGRGDNYYSDWIVIDQPMIDRFADATLDHQYIHIDPEKAAASPFGGTIAHGFLTLSLLSCLRELTPSICVPETKTTVNIGFDRVRFIRPVRAGSKVRARWTPISVEEKSSGIFQCIDDAMIECEGMETPAMSAIWITRHMF